MPFTATHPLAVVPLAFARRLRLDTTCLVIGSMSPDFEYFVRVKLAGQLGHTLRGVVLWCIPVTLVSAWLLHRLVKWPLVRVAPARTAARLAAFAERPWMETWTARAVAVLVASAAIGALTHIAWDSFTHRDMWGPRHIAELNALYIVPFWGPYPLCRILQHASTVIGGLILLVIVVRTLRRVEPVPMQTGGRWIWLGATALVGAAAFAKMLRQHNTDIGSLVTAACCGLLGGALVTGLVDHALAARRQRRGV